MFAWSTTSCFAVRGEVMVTPMRDGRQGAHLLVIFQAEKKAVR